jgi:23S rRNA C2498 (ribose-2'-O)-methylase RlmM
VIQFDSSELDFASLGLLNEKILRLQAFPRSSESSILASIRPQENVPVMFPKLTDPDLAFHPKSFTHYLSVVRVKGKYYTGIAPKKYYFSEDNAVHSVKKNKVSRAYHKIKEAVERTGVVPIDKDWICVDVGAAPGGWSLYLSERVQKVIAVDAAEVTVVKNLPNVVHLQMLSQKAGPKITDAIDMITCDINHEPQVALEAIEPIVPRLKDNGFVILTLKMPKRNYQNIEKRMNVFSEQFMNKYPGFEIQRKLWLLANLNERCFIAQKVVNKQ